MASSTVVLISSLLLSTVSATSLNNVLFNGQYDFIDLSYSFNNKTVYWPDMQDFIFTKKIGGIQTDGSCYTKMVVSTLVFSCLLVTVSAGHVDNYLHHSLNDVLFNGDYEFIDLGYSFDNNTVYWPNNQVFVFTRKNAGYRSNGWYAANDFAAGEHGGTHIDAPYHFKLSGLQVGQLPLEKLIVPLIIVDVSSKVNDNPDFVLYPRDLDYLLNDNFHKPCLVIFKFGWSKFFNNKNQYLGYNEQDGTLKFPGLSSELATWITTSYKNVVGFGVDVASVDPGASTDFGVHKITAEAGLYNIENVNLYRKIPEYGCTALVLPMKIAEGSGAPLRLVAICPKTNN